VNGILGNPKEDGLREMLLLKLSNLLKKTICCLIFVVPMATANPVLNGVASGNVSVSQTATTTQVNQSSSKAIINWNSFNVGANEKTQFIQPNSSSVTLNRINSAQGVSQILGQLISNGKIILVNGSGIFFGSTAMVNVGSIIATTSDISDANFLAGHYIFDKPSATSGSIVNQGKIVAEDAGVVALLGAQVENSGLIEARLGSVVLGAGSQFTMDFNGDQMISFAVAAPAANANVTNLGKIVAKGGQVLVSAQAMEGVLSDVINMSGLVEASSASQHSGEIILNGGNYGTVSVTGKLSTAAKHNVNASGGTIKISGLNIVLASNSMLNAAAGKNGNGGSVVVKAQNTAQASGTILAEGGALSGNGGNVETSGSYLDVSNTTVNLTGAHGATGTWLLDPSDLTISNAVTSNVNLSSGTNTAEQLSSSQVPNLNVGALTTALLTANVLVQTDVTGTGGSGDITVLNNISWSSGNTLTLSAYRNVVLETGVSIANSGGATVNLRADNTGTGTGVVTFKAGSGVSLTAGGAVNIFYNPLSYTSPMNYTSEVMGVTPTAYMLVNTAAELAEIKTNLSADYALGANITLSGNFTPIGNSTTPYTGSFDGQGFALTNLTITDATTGGNIGLFGDTSHATIANVSLINAAITETAQANTVGALAGYANSTTFTNDSMTGSVAVSAKNTSNNLYVGGLIGYLNTGTLTNSNATAQITVAGTSASGNNGMAIYAVSGLLGGTTGSTITNSFASPAGTIKFGSTANSLSRQAVTVNRAAVVHAPVVLDTPTGLLTVTAPPPAPVKTVVLSKAEENILESYEANTGAPPTYQSKPKVAAATAVIYIGENTHKKPANKPAEQVLESYSSADQSGTAYNDKHAINSSIVVIGDGDKRDCAGDVGNASVDKNGSIMISSTCSN
jgi:filamentous hemagglutinin family protein